MTDARMKALRKAVMSEARHHISCWKDGEGPATFANCIVVELNKSGLTLCPCNQAGEAM
jgi:hypothetical protein